MAKVSKSAGRAKTDPRYWRERIFKKGFTEGGERRETRDFHARIQSKGKRHEFSLGTSNGENAGKIAAAIYESILSVGWPETLAKYAPSHAPKPEREALVGDYIREAEARAAIDARTLADYASNFRRIVADIEGIDAAGKFSYRDGTRDAWLARVDRVKLSKVTPAKIDKWRLAYVRERGAGDLARERAAKISCNSVLRKARGLFSKKILPKVREILNLPDPLPFAKVEFFPRQSMRYVSRINVGEMIGQAAEELPDSHPESFKIFLLAIGAGLRAAEIDSLLWDQIDLGAGTISIEPTPYFKPKSEDSIGLVGIDPETVEILRGYRARATGIFVIESNRAPNPGASYHYLRAAKAFEALYSWLRQKGIKAGKPLHELRKEFGSQICATAGLFAASRALRHADTAITAAHYLDKGRVTIGLGRFLNSNVIPFEAGKEVAQ